MSENNQFPTSPAGGTSGGSGSNLVVYILCLVIGAVIGVLGSMALSGGVGSGADPVVAEFNGKSVRASEAFTENKQQIFELEDQLFRTKESAINAYIENRLVKDEAKKQNLNPEQLLEKETRGEDTVSDDEVNQFLLSRGAKPDDPNIKKDDVREYLKFRKRYERRQGYLAKLRQSSNVKMLIKEPESPHIAVNAEGFPSWGNAKAPVTIVEFSDFQCPYCSRAVPVITRLKKEYGPDKIRIVYVDMPLPNHNRAFPASLAAHCAEDQGKFWEMHDALFAAQDKLEDADLKERAKTLGLNTQTFNECLDSKKHEERVKKAKSEAEKAGIQATPSFVINGQLIQGAQPFEKFKEKIDKASKG